VTLKKNKGVGTWEKRSKRSDALSQTASEANHVGKTEGGIKEHHPALQKSAGGAGTNRGSDRMTAKGAYAMEQKAEGVKKKDPSGKGPI